MANDRFELWSQGKAAAVSLMALMLLGAGCATAPPPGPPLNTAGLFPSNGLLTHRGILTIRGRQYALNGYLALSEKRGMRLILSETFGGVLADLLVRPNGDAVVLRSSPMFRPQWIERYVAADVKCIFGSTPSGPCPVRQLDSKHFLIERRWYKLDLRVVEMKPGPQPDALFDEHIGSG